LISWSGDDNVAALWAETISDKNERDEDLQYEIKKQTKKQVQQSTQSYVKGQAP